MPREHNLLFEELSFAVNGACMEVHRILGPGFLEAVYQTALERELRLRGMSFEAQKRLPVVYKGAVVGDYIADIVVDDKIILELKAVSTLNKAHEAQAHNYLAATGLRLAILYNFGAASLEWKRIIR
ncbi:MAG: GxxExxY protein [Anaerolineae bacterium]|nr:GxxExxY protein [Anaerolineae bacterium]MCB0229334.1 GxxExxY protein [Anaerolineae bacterium]MCB0236772.1 GxxExxY protein [Anaerolineae bacterium]MCB0245494.1 GxxExxY protein [Anaerolineae bacterium]